LLQMIRSSQRQLTREEEIAEDTVWKSSLPNLYLNQILVLTVYICSKL
jgi:hypothetical protein